MGTSIRAVWSMSFIIFITIFPSLISCKPLADSSLGLNEVVYHDEPSMIFLGSPSIVRLSSGRLLASHDFFGSGYGSQARNVSVYCSDDDGQTWTFLSYIKHSYWTTLAVYNGMIYAIGTDNDFNGNVIIHRSDDNGASWNYNNSNEGVILFHGAFATGPTPIVVANQVMYRGMEYYPAPYRWPTDFQAAIISCNLSSYNNAAEDADPIMSPSNWRLTPPVVFDTKWLSPSFSNLTAPGFLEGNVVILPAPSSTGTSQQPIRVFNVLRFNSIPLTNFAIILELNITSNTQSFVSAISFPGGLSKFSIRYDPVTRTYLTLVNPVTSKVPSQRNILSLAYTKDLQRLSEWKIIADRLLYDDTGLTADDSIRYTSFQYVDWQFDTLSSSAVNKASCIEWNCDGGPDMIYLIRTAYRGANSYHNSNRITYKTLHNYRALIN